MLRVRLRHSGPALSASLISLALIGACDIPTTGDDLIAEDVVAGYFGGTAVEGLAYETATQSGFTDADGAPVKLSK